MFVFLQVIQYRNELMHSCDFRVKDDWIKQYYIALKLFVQQLLDDVPSMASVTQQIDNVSLFASLCSPLLDTSLKRMYYQITLYFCADADH